MRGLLPLSRGRASGGPRAGVPFALAAGLALALTAGACSTPESSRGAGEEATAAGSRPQSGAHGETGRKLPWWRLSQYSRKPGVLTPKEMQERRPGLFSGKEGAFVLYREGERDSSDDPTKPTKVRR